MNATQDPSLAIEQAKINAAIAEFLYLASAPVYASCGKQVRRGARRVA